MKMTDATVSIYAHECPKDGWFLVATLHFWVRSEDGRGQYYTCEPAPVATVADDVNDLLLCKPSLTVTAWNKEELHCMAVFARKRDIRVRFEEWKAEVWNATRNLDVADMPILESFYEVWNREARNVIKLNAIERMISYAVRRRIPILSVLYQWKAEIGGAR